jgi:cystathionine beta-lyase
MGNYDFDKVLLRTNTNSVKWSYIEEHTGNSEVLPLWVADMDFETVPEVKQELIKRAQHGIYGYTARSENYYKVIINWMKKRHNWDIQREWITHSSGVVGAIYNILYALTKEKDGIIIQPPVYHPFAKAVKETGRTLLLNPLYEEGGKYYIDFFGLKQILDTNPVSILLLCSPHNPVGKVFTKAELNELGQLCQQYGVLIISDEIHADFIFEPNKFVPFASLSKGFADMSITCTAPSKTFNLAGLSTSNIIIPNADLRNKYDNYCSKMNLKSFNIFGAIASEAAYQYGEPWLTELLKYLEDNKNFAIDWINNTLPELTLIQPEGTYFLWVDFSSLGLTSGSLEDFLLKEAALWFNQGYIFGQEGEGYARINLACQRELLKEALKRLTKAIYNRRKLYAKTI